MDNRAEAGANASGYTPGTVMISVNARITSGGATFEAPLNLQLDDLQMKLAGGEGSLVVTDSAAVAQPTVSAREIGLFGQPIMTASQARSTAILLFLAAAAGATLIAFAARRRLPLRSRVEIERRHSNLLVPVEPMASPPGKPVVNVDNFPALVKLAERYGQMILTWRRYRADDFVVRDEGITYRYRLTLEDQTLQTIEHLNPPNAADNTGEKASSQVS
jgi:hypothetical protein